MALRDQSAASTADDGESMRALLVSMGLMPERDALIPYEAGCVHPTRRGSVKLLRVISRGQYGTVWEVQRNQARLAMKVQSVRGALNQRLALREVEALRAAAHEHVVRLWDAWTTPRGDMHMVMELLGPSLAEFCCVSEQRARLNFDTLTYQLVHGMHGMHHAGVLHRDIKPDNICISHGGMLKLVDLGMASLAMANEARTPQRATLWYRAPELLLGASKYDEASDLWSAGCTLSQAYFGFPLFPETTEIGMLKRICEVFDIRPLFHLDELARLEGVRALPDLPRNTFLVRTRNRLVRLQPFMRSRARQLLVSYGWPGVRPPSSVYVPWTATDVAA